MSVTVNQSIMQKANEGVTIAFPDVCKMQSPPTGPLPLPYPTMAKTANAVQQKRKVGVAGTAVQNVSSKYFSTTAPSTTQNKLEVQAEIQQLKGLLNQINSKLLALSTPDPNQWQLVVQEYAVAASALYLTIHGK